MTCDIGPVPQVSVSTKRCGFQSREQARRPRSGTEPSHHLNVVLSKAALSGPSVCLRARAPCPLRVSCPVTDRAQSAQLCAPSRIARARSPAARSRASCGSLGQDRLIARRSAHARTDCAPPRILCKIDDNSVPVFDTSATNLFITVPTLTRISAAFSRVCFCHV